MLKTILLGVTTLVMLTSAAKAEGTYMGMNISDNTVAGNSDTQSVGAFLGYEVDFNSTLYTAVEASIQIGGDTAPLDKENVAVDLKVGLKLRPNIQGYSIVGYGGDIRYGFGGKYDINDVYFVSAEFIHQEFTLKGADTMSLRGGLKF
jgi:hypothetical protein